MEDKDKSIIINGSFANATELVVADGLEELETYEDVVGAITSLAELLIAEKIKLHEEHGIGKGGSGNSSRSSKRSSTSKKRGSTSKSSGSRKGSGRGGSRKRSGGGDGKPSDKQLDLYERVYEALDEDGFDLGDYPTPDELTFEEAKTDIGELMDEAKSRDLEF